jgi:hypothetical protein
VTAMHSVGTLGYLSAQASQRVRAEAEMRMRAAAFERMYDAEAEKYKAAKLFVRQQAMNAACAGTAMSMYTTGAMIHAATTASYYRAHACHTACGCSGKGSAPEITHKEWLPTEAAKEAVAEAKRQAANRRGKERVWYVNAPPPTLNHPPLSLKTSPLFGFMRWRFDSPFAPLVKMFERWAIRTHRRIA